MQNKLYYLNPSIKKVGLVEEYNTEQVLEYQKCSNDVSYFTENYVKIVSLDKGLVPFILRPYQKRLVESYANNKNTITLQPRQGGKCLFINTIVKIRNKKTGLIEDITIGDLYERAKNKAD